LITVLGHAALLSKAALGVVGARNASLIGRKIAEEFSCAVAAAGYVIVSGLARGIDASAHTAALATGTVAVVAGGRSALNNNHPEGTDALVAFALP